MLLPLLVLGSGEDRKLVVVELWNCYEGQLMLGRCVLTTYEAVLRPGGGGTLGEWRAAARSAPSRHAALPRKNKSVSAEENSRATECCLGC